MPTPSFGRMFRSLVALVLSISLAAGLCAIGSTSAASAPLSQERRGLAVGSLSVEHLRHPLGIDVPKPRLGWVNRAAVRGDQQSAYRVLVSTSRAALRKGRGATWDSGKVRSAKSYDVVYGGPALASSTRYFWKVRTWNRNGQASAWSHPSYFETAFMDPQQGFTGSWIGRTIATDAEVPEPLLRTEFVATKRIKSARLYIAGLGYHKAYLNGVKVGDHQMDPGFTHYSKRVYYVTHDVTKLLKRGTNALGVRLGRGYYADKGTVIVDDNHNWKSAPWHSEPKLNLALQITFNDGTQKKIVSDDGWVTTDGPTLVERPGNETYDARLAKPGWTRPGYDASGWTPAVVVPPPGTGTPATLQAQPNEPIKITRTFKPVKVTTPVDGVRVYEFPVMTAGWARIVLRGKEGSEVKVRYAEKLAPDGTAELEGLSKQEDTYILRGGRREVYQPSYSYKGFLYVQVSGTDLPKVLRIEAQQVVSAVRSTGGFRSSSPLLNAYHQAMRQTILNNMHSIPTDTPTYEKAGWTADAHLFGTSAMRNFGTSLFYEKYMQDIEDFQLPSGDVPSIVPSPADLNFLLDPAWAAAVVIIPYDLWQNYGDLTVVRRHYDAMAKWMTAMEGEITATGFIFNGPVAFGDWVTPTNGKVQSAQIHGTAYVYRGATLLAEMAAAIGKSDDADRWTRLAENIKLAYNVRFYRVDQQVYLNNPLDTTPLFPEHGTSEANAYAQTSQLEALAWGLAAGSGVGAGTPLEVDQDAVFDNLVADVEAKDNHLATGASGTKLILPVLTDGGRADLAYKVAMNPTYPGWGFWFKNGATTMWETWAKEARSRGHAFMGTVDDWLFTRVAGIKPAAPGFRKIDFKPYPGGGLTYAAAHQRSPFGVVSTCWQDGPAGSFGLDVSVPAGSTGTVYFPKAGSNRIVEVAGGSRVPAGKAPGVELLKSGDGRTVYRVQSGTYRFETGRPPLCPS